MSGKIIIKDDTLFVTKDNYEQCIIIEGHHKPMWAIPIEYNIVVIPEFFNRVKIYQIGHKAWAMFEKGHRRVWLELDGKMIDTYEEIFLNITMREDYIIADVLVTVEITFKEGDSYIHGPRCQIELANLGI